MCLASLLRRLKQRRLDLVEALPHRAADPVQLGGHLAAGAARGHNLPRGHVARADFEPQRHALRLPLEVLGTGLEAVPRIELNTDPRLLELRFHLNPDT